MSYAKWIIRALDNEAGRLSKEEIPINTEQAFQTLLAGVASALNESLARHAQAARQGDLEALDAESNLQQKLVAALNQLLGMRAMWPSLLEQPAATQSKTPPTEQRGTEGPVRRAGRGAGGPGGEARLLPGGSQWQAGREMDLCFQRGPGRGQRGRLPCVLPRGL